MKCFFATLLITYNFSLCYSQALTTSSAQWISSGVCVERSIDNFIAITNLKKSDFEAQMKSLGASISYNEDFCVIAAEQLASGISLGHEAFIFMKCDNAVKVIWYGRESESGFKIIMELLEPYYLGAKEGVRGYGIVRGNEHYLFTIERKRDGTAMFETMYVARMK